MREKTTSDGLICACGDPAIRVRPLLQNLNVLWQANEVRQRRDRPAPSILKPEIDDRPRGSGFIAGEEACRDEFLR